jgi:WD40 repeat protein
MRGHTDGVNGVAFFNDGHRVVTGSQDKTLRIWNVQKGTLLGEPLAGLSVILMHQFAAIAAYRMMQQVL